MKETGQEEGASVWLEPKAPATLSFQDSGQKARDWLWAVPLPTSLLTRVAALPTQHPSAEGACEQPPRETQADLQPGGEGGGPTSELGGAGGGKAGTAQASAGEGAVCAGRTPPLNVATDLPGRL